MSLLLEGFMWGVEIYSVDFVVFREWLSGLQLHWTSTFESTGAGIKAPARSKLRAEISHKPCTPKTYCALNPKP